MGEQVAAAARAHGLPAAPARQRAAALLEEVGLPARAATAYPHQLSGGQQQRALIAAALSAEPALLLADEPTTSLDATVQAQVLEVLDGLRRRRGLAMLFISHDLGVVARMADEVAVLEAGRIVERGPTQQLLAAPCHPVTRALLAARTTAAPALPGRVSEAGPALQLDGVTLCYRTPGHPMVTALDDVSLVLPAGAALGLVGESGSGKSTLTRLALGLQRPQQGTVALFGADPAGRGRRRGIARQAQLVFQDATGSLNPRLRVADLLAEPFRVHRLCPANDLEARCAALLAEVDLEPDHLRRYPH